MTEMAHIVRACPEIDARNLLPNQRKALSDITACRTETLGGQLWRCERCRDYRYSYHSCKNRHCPKCGNDTATAWLEKQRALLTPARHFLVTATLPEELRSLAWKNQQQVYGLMMSCAAAAIRKLAKDPKYVGGEVGIIAVLQTWRRDLRYHPHVHFIVTGGGLSGDGKTWLPAQRDYLMPQKALAKIFRAKFRDALKKTGLFEQAPPQAWRKDWVVDIRPVGTGQTALKYLAPYVFRVAISNRRIVQLKDGQVTFRYKQSGSKRWQTQTLPAEKFVARFLMHVLPHRFVKVRYYGFFSPRKRRLLQQVSALFEMAVNNAEDGSQPIRAWVMQCPVCKKAMLFVDDIKPQRIRSP